MATEAEIELATIPRWYAIPMILAGGIAAIAAGQFVRAAAAEAIGFAVVMVIFTTMLWWPLRRQAISWAVIAAVVIFHLVLIGLVPWPKLHQPNKGDLLFLVVDLFGVLIISAFIERRIRANHRNNI